MQISDLRVGSTLHHISRGVLTVKSLNTTAAVCHTVTGAELVITGAEIDVTVGAGAPIIIWPNPSDRVATARKLTAKLAEVLA